MCKKDGLFLALRKNFEKNVYICDCIVCNRTEKGAKDLSENR